MAILSGVRSSYLFRLLSKAKKVSIKFVESIRLIRISRVIRKISMTPDFPGSAGSQYQWLDIAIRGAQMTLPSLLELKRLNQNITDVEIMIAKDEYALSTEVLELRKIFDENGSDKGSINCYDLVYVNLLNGFKSQPLEIMEIGIGSNYKDTPSNMGKQGTPGASLRSWRDFFPKANVVGCDVDPRILFTENRIETFPLDQTDVISWKSLKKALGNRTFHLIIDDGLHAPYANLRTLLEAGTLLKTNGVLVIEDVREQAIVVWELVATLLGDSWSTEIVKTKKSYMVLLRKAQ
jgi:hypothetical protein